jgi:gamma-butyrobetaine dioxygenase
VTEPLDQLADLFADAGVREYFGEAVSVSTHMLQAAALAERDGAPPALVAAALLHDVGHLRPADGPDDRHEQTGPDWLSQWFGEDVTEPIRLHVDAKRYLCAVEPDYRHRLSEESVKSLARQGGVMSMDETRRFGELSYAEHAIRVRRWDEAAKDPDAPTPGFDHYRPMLAGLLRSSLPPTGQYNPREK